MTDRIQMFFIWMLLFGLIVFYSYHLSKVGFSAGISTIPVDLRSIKWNSGLLSFVIGIFIMNLLTYVSNMGLWQRIAGSQEASVVIKGMRGSVFQSAISWSLFVFVAIGAYLIVKPIDNENLLVTLLKSITETLLGKIAIFLVVLGLYGAMLSTASTQLIAVSHTIYEDIVAKFRKISLKDRISLKRELLYSRIILILSAITAIVVVEILRLTGFTVADLAFSIYGAALGLVPPIIFGLYLDRNVTYKLSIWASLAVILGFSASWIGAIYGKIIHDGNLIFLAPLFSTVVSTFVLTFGWLITRTNRIIKK